MLGFNWIDLIIIGLVIGAVVAGLRIGFLIQLYAVTGFFAGLFFAGWLFPHLLPIDDRTLKTLINGNLVLLCAAYAAFRAFDLAEYIHFSLKGWGHKLESRLGILISIAGMLLIVWLLAAMIGRLPFEGFSNSANDAVIVQFLDRHLPPVPAVFAEFNRTINPNSSPHIFVHSKLQVIVLTVPALTANLQSAAAAAEASTVRITGFGCGGIAAGSGFVAVPDLIMTNAHVVAGVRRPIVKFNNQSYAAVPILFNPNLDLAILRVKNLPAKALALASDDSAANTSVVLTGYPLGNYTAVPGIVRDAMHVFGANIYSVGTIGRDIYEVQAQVDHGSSGGPMLSSNGQVVGMVFAKSDSLDNYGYALTSPSLLSQLQHVEKSYQRVSTGVCLAG